MHSTSSINSIPCRAFRTLDANSSEMTRREVVNAKKKILRKAGVYRDPNRARNDSRKEIAYLRQQMDKLQIDLKSLEDRRKRRMQQQERLSEHLIVVYSAPQILNMWQVIAEKQRQRREEAERENARLKLITERQQKAADSLSSLLKKRENQSMNDCASFMDVSPRQRIVHVVDFHGDISRVSSDIMTLLDEK
ncbi:hypothetical protein L914_13893 [Phytophthora nicotianae]|uniref:Uncharacterized protein n=2 Tax=Phytophthora nicotianae TaxID=4792 RepID=V9EPY3_PHYNI|nr:hypothetical protein F443_14436 [Phytophthora nicotianae P1569]ETM40046.1 hypothetical protein L914_13893 [Phytophthora nicotianae]